MNKRMLQMLIAVAVFLGAIGFVKFQQISAAIAQGKSFKPPPEAVTTLVARVEPWADAIDAVGSIAPSQGVTLSADQPGVVSAIAFQSGARVRAGQALVSLDTRQERAQLAAAEAQRELARVNLDRAHKLAEQQLIAQAELDQAAAQFKQADATVSEMRATIDRKTIRAPFSGVTGIRQVNLGQYLHSGDAVVPLQSLDFVYANFAVPQQQAGSVRVGDVVEARTDGNPPTVATGRISTINPVVDDATRNQQMQATFANRDGHLRPGMYVTVKVLLGHRDPVIALPSTAINFAPYGNSVFIVEKMKGPDGASYLGVRQQFVKLGRTQGDQVAVLDGVKAGQEIVTSGVFKLRSGAAVTVNNSIRPSDSLTPKPGDS